MKWMTCDSIGMRGYAQHDPVLNKRGIYNFDEMNTAIRKTRFA